MSSSDHEDADRWRTLRERCDGFSKDFLVLASKNSQLDGSRLEAAVDEFRTRYRPPVKPDNDSNDLYLFRWLVDQNFTVQRYPNNPGHKKWLVLDFDSEEITSGTSAIDAIQRAHDEFDNPSDEQIERNAAKYREEREAGRAEELADRRQAGESC